MEVAATWARVSVIFLPSDSLCEHRGQAASPFWSLISSSVKRESFAELQEGLSEGRFRKLPCGCWAYHKSSLNGSYYKDCSHGPSNPLCPHSPPAVLWAGLGWLQDVLLQDSGSGACSPLPGACSPDRGEWSTDTHLLALPLRGQEGYHVSFSSLGPLKYEL